MRLLQLATPSGETLDLHPRLSVVCGLSADTREALLSTVRGLTRPDTVHAARGRLEAHGVIFDLDPTALRALDLDGTGVDPVVSGGDLPGDSRSVDPRELRAKEKEFAALVAMVAEKAEAETQARAAVDRASAALARAQAALTEAEGDLAARLTNIESLRAELDRLEATRADADRDVAEATAALEVSERALAEVTGRTAGERSTLESARARLGGLEAALEQARAHADEDAPGAVEAALARETMLVEQLGTLDGRSEESAQDDTHDDEPTTTAEARAAELERTLLGLELADPTAVEQALAAVEGRLGESGEPSPEAAALADEIDAVVAEIGDHALVEVDAAVVDAARSRLDAARQALIAAEEAIRNPHLDPAKVAAIEAAHDELLQAVDKASSRLGGGRARARLDALRAAEHEALSALGFHSYTDYMMGNSTMSADTAAQANLQAARRELTAAEQAWAEVEDLTEAALAQATVMDRRRDLVRRAEALLGNSSLPFAGLAGALRQVRELPAEVRAAADDLRDALAGAGLEVADLGLDLEDLADLARTWLAEASAVERRRTDVKTHLARLRGESALPADDSRPEGEGSADDDAVRRDLEAQLAAARAATTDARARLAAHGEAEADRQRLADEVAAAEAEVEALRQAAGEAEQEHQRAVADRDGRAAALEAAMSARAQADQAAEVVRSKLAELDERAAGGADGLAAAVEEAEVALLRARSELEAATAAVTALNDEGQAIALEVERLQDIVAATDGTEVSSASELEWYILARLAAQRSVSLAGSLPLVIDDAFEGLPADDVAQVLERLEPMTETVQVIVVSDDDAVASWAAEAGPARAAVVAPAAA